MNGSSNTKLDGLIEIWMNVFEIMFPNTELITSKWYVFSCTKRFIFHPKGTTQGENKDANNDLKTNCRRLFDFKESQTDITEIEASRFM